MKLKPKQPGEWERENMGEAEMGFLEQVRVVGPDSDVNHSNSTTYHKLHCSFYIKALKATYLIMSIVQLKCFKNEPEKYSETSFLLKIEDHPLQVSPALMETWKPSAQLYGYTGHLRLPLDASAASIWAKRLNQTLIRSWNHLTMSQLLLQIAAAQTNVYSPL